MTRFRKWALGLVWVLGLGILPALAAGIWQGMPAVNAVGGATPTLPLVGNEFSAFDTGLASGAYPQTEAISVAQIKLFVNTPSVLTDVANVAATCATGLNPDMSLGEVYTITLNVAHTCLGTPTNLVAGKTFRIIVTEDATGSRDIHVPTGGIWTFNVAATASPIGLTTTASTTSIITGVYDGTKIRAQTTATFN